MTTTTPRLTTHQRRVLDDVAAVTRVHRSKGVPVAVHATRTGVLRQVGGDTWWRVYKVGAPAALEHLADKGFLGRVDVHTPRGRTVAYTYTTTTIPCQGEQHGPECSSSDHA